MVVWLLQHKQIVQVVIQFEPVTYVILCLLIVHSCIPMCTLSLLLPVWDEPLTLPLPSQLAKGVSIQPKERANQLIQVSRHVCRWSWSWNVNLDHIYHMYIHILLIWQVDLGFRQRRLVEILWNVNFHTCCADSAGWSGLWGAYTVDYGKS